MKGDFSRLTGLKAKRKHYNGVLKQQGRVQLDSDWNELISIIAHQRKTRTIDTIGQCGAPIHSSGFQILHSSGLNDLLISSGRFYAGGLLAETTPSSTLPILEIETGGSLIVEDTRIDGMPLEVGQWVQIITENTPEGIIGKLTTVGNGVLNINQDVSPLIGERHPYLRRLILFSDQVDYPQPSGYTPVVGQTDLLYLDVWERYIPVVVDPNLREVALGGPDTDTRSKIIAQVKILPDVGDVVCEDDIDDWNALIKPPNGRMTTRLVDPPTPTDPCQLGESGGYLGLENHFYRVEIHDVDTGGNAIFKWSRDNAAFAYGVKEFFEETGGAVFKISLQQNGKDEILKIKQQDWIEVSGDETDLDTNISGTLAKVLKVEGDILTLDTDVSAHKDEAFPKIRRWDISIQRPNVTTVATAGTGYQLEDGIEIEFSGTEFKVGDYWVFSARVLTGEIELLEKEPPHGVQHHYCKLALVTGETGGEVDIEDCRPEFPPLTELPDTGGCCTVTVGEDGDFQDIQLAIDSLNGGPGEVCIHSGTYEIDRPILVEGEDITIRGCGGTPIIVNTATNSSGIVFIIRDSRDIHIHDVWCFSIEDSTVVEIENSLYVRLNNGMFVAGGTSEEGSVIKLLGFTMESRIYDNIILGMIGVRYDSVDGQSLNAHLLTRIEKNIMYVLKHGLYQEEEGTILGFDMKENLIQGLDIDLMSKSFFPEPLFKSAIATKRYDAATVKKAQEARTKGAKYESLRRTDTKSAYGLNATMKVTSAEARVEAQSHYAYDTKVEATAASPRKTTIGAIISFGGTLIDANFTDNILTGYAGITANQIMEFTINNNLIFIEEFGIELFVFEGVTIKNNLIRIESDGDASTDVGFYGIGCFGEFIYGLSVTNNRIFSKEHGVIFVGNDDRVKSQVAFNIQIDKNIIVAPTVGIALASEVVILLFDLTIVDNSIVTSQIAGIYIYVESGELQGALDNSNALQRVIERNSISVRGAGILMNLARCKVLDNDININPEANSTFFESRGIILQGDDCTISNNTIRGNTNSDFNSYGGIYLELESISAVNNKSQTRISNNRILGGIHNGIEIVSDVDGLVIEENLISGMGLNGIAVQPKVEFVNNLSIKGNQIKDCLSLAGISQNWWKYAGIVLTTTRNTQINGNTICDNRADENLPTINMGAFYADKINEISISDNHFINNGRQDQVLAQSVIHIPLRTNTPTSIVINSDIQITNNIVKSGRSSALTLGSNVDDGKTNVATDENAIITNNHFEATTSGLFFCFILLNINKLIFASNYVSIGQSNASTVLLLSSKNVMANNNVISGPISGTGVNQQIINNLQIV